MALAVVDVPDRAALADAATLRSFTILCRSSQAPEGAPKPIHRHPAAQDIGVLAWDFGQPAALPATGCGLPAPSSTATRRLALAQPRAPPVPAHLHAFARGPPSLV